MTQPEPKIITPPLPAESERQESLPHTHISTSQSISHNAQGQQESETCIHTSDTMIVHNPRNEQSSCLENSVHLHELGSENNSRIPENDVISAGSESSWFSFMFEASSDEYRFDLMCFTLSILTYAYTFCACANFYSSFYPVHQMHRHTSNVTEPVGNTYVTVDSVLMSTSIMCIDISSAIFIISGFLATYMYHNMRAEEFVELKKIAVIYIIIDLWAATAVTLIFGCIYHLIHHSFKPKDLLLTCLQGLTGLHVFEWHQNADAWHSWNPTNWPIGSLLYAFMLTSCTVQGNAHLRKLSERSGPTLVLLNAIFPIFILSLFALLREDTNIFYANATNFGYRLLEFNLGTAVYCTLQTHMNFIMSFLRVLEYCSVPIFFTFVLIWFSELGVKMQKSSHTCIRMYEFSPCIKAHHGFLMRGCILGLTMLSRTVAVHDIKPILPSVVCLPMATKQRHIAPLVSVAVFVWPSCYVISLLLEINFSKAVIHENAALLLFVTPHIVFVVAYVWKAKIKPRVFDAVESTWEVLKARMKRGRPENAIEIPDR